MKRNCRRAFFSLSAFALLVGLAGRVASQEVLEAEKGLFATRDQSLSARMGSRSHLLIRSAVNLSGTLEIQTDTGSAVRVVYSKKARASTRKKGTDIIDLIGVGLTPVAEEVRFELRAPNPPPWETATEGGLVAAKVSVPQNCSVEIEAASFDVVANGPLKSLIVRSSLGRIDARDVTEQLDLSTVNRRVVLDDISGDISVSTTNSSIEANNITGTVGPARFRNEGGDIKIEGFTGAINVRNSYGRVDIAGFQPVGGGSFIRSTSGPVILEITRITDGQVVVTNEYEDIEISVPDTISAFFALKVDDEGTIEATNFPFRSDLVEHSRLNLRSGTGLAGISGTVRGKGNIYVRGTRGE